MTRPQPKPELTPEQAEQERLADQRDAEAVHRFFGHVLGGTLKPNCSRANSSQRTAQRMRRKKKGKP